VAFNGSVVEQYPGYRQCLQGFVDGLLAQSEDGKEGAMVLVEARESSLRGAAVALACLA
jgi:hexokinase